MNILLFGITRDIVGSSTLSMSQEDFENLKTVGDLKDFLKQSYPKLNELSSLAIAVNNAYAEEEEQINVQDEIALIPPVSGG